MFSFKYSARPNTLASKRMPDDVSEAEKTARIVALQALQREIQTRLHERRVGTTVDVLIDSASRRRDDGDLGADEREHRRELAGADRYIGATRTIRSPAAQWIGRTVPVRIRRAGRTVCGARRRA